MTFNLTDFEILSIRTALKQAIESKKDNIKKVSKLNIEEKIKTLFIKLENEEIAMLDSIIKKFE